MTEKFRLKDAKPFLFRAWYALRFSAMLFGLALIVQSMTLTDLLAQESGKHKVMGKITAASDNSSVPGANIIIKGTTLGTVTDVQGNFSIDANDNDILIISFIGYLTEEIAVAGKSTIEVNIVENVAKLDEIVVIGYGTTKRKDVTGAISSIKSEDILKTQPVTIEQSLQGKIPGLVIQQISGQPGGGVSVQIRGLTSFDGGQPLYVVDGIQLTNTGSMTNGSNPLAGLNPSEIESIDVLKDASATAIYGNKGTDGVILITTKRGSVSAPKISYDFYTGFQQIPRKLDVMNLREYATFTNDRSHAINWEWDARPEFANPQYFGKGTDWQSELFRNAPMTSHTISVGGGDARTSYFLSGSYFNQEGIAQGSDFNRMSVRLNLDNKTTNWLKIGTSIQLVNIDENVNSSSSKVIEDALKQTPDTPVKNSDGSWGGRYNDKGWVATTANPVATASINKADRNRKELYSNLYAEVTFARGLMLRNEVTGNFAMKSDDNFNPTYTMGNIENPNNSGSYDNNEDVNTSINNYLTYSHLFANKYNITAMVGHEASFGKSANISGSRQKFPSNSVQAIGSGDLTTSKNDGKQNHSARESYFGRLNFGLNDKYLFTGTIREDGESKYSVDNRWVMSYSGAFAWKMNQEPFLKSITAISELKLRMGYGLTNKAGGRAYAYASQFKSVATGLSGASQYQYNIGNPDLEWEQTKSANIALDASFFDWRLNFTVDFYNKRTDGLCMKASLPSYTGIAASWSPGTFESPDINVGSINNKGLDFRISTTNIKGKEFNWRTDLTVSYNINKVIKLNTDGAAITGWPVSRTEAGRTIGEFYGYVVEGVYTNPIDFLGDPANGIAPVARPVDSDGKMYPVGTAAGSIWYGDIKFKDLNGDGVIDSKDQTFLGSPIPKVQLGLNNTFSYKNFDLNIFFTANYGNKIYNQMRISGEDSRQSTGNLKVILNHAKLGLIDPEGPSITTTPDGAPLTEPEVLAAINNVYVINPGTKIQGLRNDDTNGNNRASDRYIEDGSFIKCKTISLGYNVPQNLLKRLHFASLRVYANVSNAFTITKYTGMDPEIGSWNPTTAGVDGGYYPQSRIYTFGLNISLN